MRHGNRHIAFSAVPWRAWRRPIMFWVPAILLFWTAIIGLALAFDYINGFHDAANSIATVVSTRVLSPRSTAKSTP